MNVDAVLAEVAEAEGLDDYGDPTFREGLDLLVDSALGEAQLNDIGRAALESQVRDGLRNRLRVVDWHGRHDHEPVEAPVFLIGASRTGTTALSQLLGADPGNRSLLGWEVRDTVPPAPADRWEDDPRFVAALEAPDMLALLNPGFRAIHHDPPDAPIECVTALAQHFNSAQFVTTFNLPSYHRWLLGTDHGPAYRYHRMVLQVLQSGKPGRWSLKSPHHALAPDALLATYPGAALVVTHRDPVKTLASTCSLVLSLTGTFSDAEWTRYVAETWTETVDAMVNRVIDFRDQNPEVPVVDVYYDDFVADPIGTVGAIYDELGRALLPDAERAMRAMAEREPQGKHGRHTYSLADVGLRREEVEERFARYYEQFGVRREDA
jgi:hypothetical protein